jgi:hypothetical protein
MAHARLLSRHAICILAVAVSTGCAAPGASSAPITCVAGMPCTTDNPGACAMGHTMCTSGKQACMPDVTEQPCYTGEPETLGRGACRAGTQSCIGKLGACTGEVLPMMENCFNDIDDDCDRHVNNGCPDTVSIGATDPLTQRGGGGGSTAGTSLCPSGTVVTAAQFQLSQNMMTGYVVSVQANCATPTLVRGASDYSVALMPVDAPGAISATDGARPGTTHINCSGGGFSAATGAQGSTYTNAGHLVIESLGINCSTVSMMLDKQNRLLLTFARDDAHSGVASAQPGGDAFSDDCAANEVLVGFQGRTGAQMDQIQGVCAPLSITYK